MRAGIRTVITALVLGGISLTAVAVHAAWYRTASQNSRALVRTLVLQITDQVRKEFWYGVVGVEEQFAAMREIVRDRIEPATDLNARTAILREILHLGSRLHWVAHVAPDGSFASARRSDASGVDTISCQTTPAGPMASYQSWRLDKGKLFAGTAETSATHFDARGEPWFAKSAVDDNATWSPISNSSFLEGSIAVLSAPVSRNEPEKGMLATFRRVTDLSQALGSIEVGLTGGAFLLGPDGVVVVTPEKMGGQTPTSEINRARLMAAANAAGQRIRDRPENAKNQLETVRLAANGENFSISLSPLEFRNWQLAVIIPEAEFLADIEATTRKLVIALLLVVLAAGLASTWLARRLVADPVRELTADLKKIEMFELAGIERRPTRLAEFHALGEAIQRVSIGLSAFGKYIPTDLVRNLLAEGVEALPGGKQRELTVLFMDIAGFTGLSERMGVKVVPLIGAYFDLMSRTIATGSGSIDKFIGDAVMAFWGPPAPTPTTR